MKRSAIAFALMCVLSTSIIAGEMPTGGKSEPPPPGNMPTVGAASSGDGSVYGPTGNVITRSSLLATVIITIISLR